MSNFLVLYIFTASPSIATVESETHKNGASAMTRNAVCLPNCSGQIQSTNRGSNVQQLERISNVLQIHTIGHR